VQKKNFLPLSPGEKILLPTKGPTQGKYGDRSSLTLWILRTEKNISFTMCDFFKNIV